jgi:hypothetical protein
VHKASESSVLKKQNEIEGFLMGPRGLDEITAKVPAQLPAKTGLASVPCRTGTLPLARVSIPVECTDSAGRLTSRLAVSGQERKKTNLPPPSLRRGLASTNPSLKHVVLLYMPF